MENLFAELLHPDSLFIWFSALVSFLIGFITAWLMWGSKAKRFKAEAEKWKKSYDDLLAQHQELREELDLKEADLAKAQREAHEAIALAQTLEAEKDKWQADLDAALESSVKAQATISSYQATIEDLNNQIVGLKALNAELSQGGTGAPGEGSTLIRLSELEAKIHKLESGQESLVLGSSGDAGKLEEVQQSYTEALSRIEAMEKQLQSLTKENESLKAQQDNGNGEAAGTDENDQIFAPSPEVTDIDKGETISLSAVAARDEILDASGKQWPAATEADKDDLTRIKGIGSFIEKKLNGLGIYTYEQVSKFDHYWIERLTAAIEFFPGRIERDDWVGQAGRLMVIKEESPEALDPSAIFPKNMEDLKIVEGIGPKIEKLLKDNDIPDLPTLSKTNEDKLREILAEAGKRYRIHDPTTWPIQAELAAKGEWEKLKELQDQLIGGRELE